MAKEKNIWLGMAFVLAAGLLIGYYVHSLQAPVIIVSEDFKSKDVEAQRQQILSEISLAIEKAEAEGLYECCIDPPCDMCFLNGLEHQWSRNGKYCACDEILEEGGTPCPQCVRGLSEGRRAIHTE